LGESLILRSPPASPSAVPQSITEALAMNTSVTAKLCVALAVIVILMVSEGDAVPVCSGVEIAPAQVSNCKYGIDTDVCGRTVCAKGPGRSCGGRRSINGSCGEGLYCACNRCTGCSPTTFECFYGQFC
ncbi:unnamed protein product, partial [Meganyctiphanes norvegica]